MTLAEMKAACERGEDATDWERLHNEQERGIEPPIDEDSPDATAAMQAVIERGRPKSPLTKEKISVRLDPDVLSALRASGPGWQTRMNVLLRRGLNLSE